MLTDAVAGGACTGGDVTLAEEWAAFPAPFAIPIALAVHATEGIRVTIDETDPRLTGDIVRDRAGCFVIHFRSDATVSLDRSRWRTCRLEAWCLWNCTGLPEARLTAKLEEKKSEEEHAYTDRTKHSKAP